MFKQNQATAFETLLQLVHTEITPHQRAELTGVLATIETSVSTVPDVPTVEIIAEPTIVEKESEPIQE